MRIACLLGDDYDDAEFRVPYERLRAAGHEVILVGLRKSASLLGRARIDRTVTDQAIEQARPQDFDGVLLPGSAGLRSDPQVPRLLAALGELPLLALGRGPLVLAAADLVYGRTLTAAPSVRRALRLAGARVLDEEVVVDGNLVTSRTIADVEPFLREALYLLGGAETSAFI